MKEKNLQGKYKCSRGRDDENNRSKIKLKANKEQQTAENTVRGTEDEKNENEQNK